MRKEIRLVMGRVRAALGVEQFNGHHHVRCKDSEQEWEGE